MEPAYQPTDSLHEQRPDQLPGSLKTLTLLTFIGCGIAYLKAVYGFYSNSNIEAQRATLEEAQDKASDNLMASKLIQNSIDMLQKNYDYRYILLLSGILFTTLCLVGALQMRQLKKIGFSLYVIGEITPVVLTAILIGFNLLGGIAAIMGIVVAVVFILLYARQRKYLVHS